METEIHVGKILEKVVADQHLNKAQLARKIKMTAPNAAYTLRNSSMPVEKLISISRAFQYNFFREIANMLQITEPATDKTANEKIEQELAALTQECNTLKVELARLETENTYLKKIIDVFAERK